MSVIAGPLPFLSSSRRRGSRLHNQNLWIPACAGMTMSRWSATFTAKILEVFALNYKVLIEAFIHVRVVTPLLLNFNAVAL